MKLRFGHIELFVKDVHKAQAFYRDVIGFEVTALQGDEYVWMKLDQIEILFRPGSPLPKSEEYHQAAAGFVLYTSDLDDTLASLKANSVAPFLMDSEPGCFTFTDPDGNWFQLVDPRSQQ